MRPMRFAFLGLSITSSWGNGHATTYRGLLRELAARGHDVLFLERDVPWYASHRDLETADYCRVELYEDLEELDERFRSEVAAADCAILGSYVPDGVEVGRWMLDAADGVTAFYDIDTPITLARLEAGDREYLAPELVPGFDLYLSFAGGPCLERLEGEFGARRALPLPPSADPDAYAPAPGPPDWDLAYLGTYSEDRRAGLEEFLFRPSALLEEGAFAVAGSEYPDDLSWPANVERLEHLPPPRHRWFYNNQRFTLNLTRGEMVRAGHSPSVRLFEAAACGTPVISDWWTGLDAFFRPGEEILVARSAEDVLGYLCDMDEEERVRVGRRARTRVLAEHTPGARAETLERWVAEAR